MRHVNTLKFHTTYLLSDHIRLTLLKCQMKKLIQIHVVSNCACPVGMHLLPISCHAVQQIGTISGAFIPIMNITDTLVVLNKRSSIISNKEYGPLGPNYPVLRCATSLMCLFYVGWVLIVAWLFAKVIREFDNSLCWWCV